MNFIISGKNIDVTPGLKDAIEQKLGKLERYFTPETEIIVTLSVEKERQKIEVTIPVKGNIIRSEQTSDDMYVSVDLVEEVIERQLRKYKNKLVARSQGHPYGSGNNFKKEFFESEDDTSVDDEIRIVRTKRFGIKPMYPEDACIQMDLLGHAFFVFCNAETDEVNVVYKSCLNRQLFYCHLFKYDHLTIYVGKPALSCSGYSGLTICRFCDLSDQL